MINGFNWISPFGYPDYFAFTRVNDICQSCSHCRSWSRPLCSAAVSAELEILRYRRLSSANRQEVELTFWVRSLMYSYKVTPFQKVVLYTIVSDSKALMWHLVERLAEVKQDGVYLLAFVRSCCKVLECQDKLALAGPSLAKSMLLIRQSAMGLKVLHNDWAGYVPSPCCILKLKRLVCSWLDCYDRLFWRSEPHMLVSNLEVLHFAAERPGRWVSGLGLFCLRTLSGTEMGYCLGR